MWDDGSAGGYEGGNYEIITDDDFLNALALPQFQANYLSPGPQITQAQMATPGDYSTFGTSAGFGTGAGNPGAGFAGPQSLGSSNSSFVMISPVAPGPPEDAAAPEPEPSPCVPRTPFFVESSPGFKPLSVIANRVNFGTNVYDARRNQREFLPGEYDRVRKASETDEPFFDRHKGSENYFQFPQLKKPSDDFDIQTWRQDHYMECLPRRPPREFQFSPMPTRQVPFGQSQNTSGQMIRRQPRQGQSTSGQMIQGQPGQGQSTSGQMIQGQPGQGQYTSEQMIQGQLGQGQSTSGQMIQGQPGQGQPTSGQMIQGQPGQGQYTSGQMIQGQPGQGQSTSGQMIQGQPGQGQSTSGQMIQGQPGQGQYSSGQMIQGQPGQGQMSPANTIQYQPIQNQTGQVPMNPNRTSQGRMSFAKLRAFFERGFQK